MLFDFFVMRHGGSFLIETAAEKTAELVKRLDDVPAPRTRRHRGRKRQIRRPGGLALRASAGARRADVANVRPSAAGTGNAHAVGARRRIATDRGSRPRGQRHAADYHAHRIALGVPEGGKDYAFGDTFPHEANLDLLNGVSFSKGCFVGQEVVSRMQHRGTARKRIVIVEGRRTAADRQRDHGRAGDHRHDRLRGRQRARWRSSVSTGWRKCSAKASRSPLRAQRSPSSSPPT